MSGTLDGTEQGILYGIGLGPGDPKLVTVRAAEILRSVDAVAFPAGGRAEAVAREYMRSDAEVLSLDLPMTKDRNRLENAWDRACERLAAQTRAGRSVAYLCLGDSLLYGSFGYLPVRYPGPVEVVPGVISPVAAAAKLHLPLVEGSEMLTLVPDGSDTGLLRRALSLGGATVIMKPSLLSEASIRLLRETGALERAWVTENVSLEAQRILPAGEAELGSLPYFALLLILPVREGDNHDGNQYGGGRSDDRDRGKSGQTDSSSAPAPGPPLSPGPPILFVGAGPGDPELITLKGARMLARAEVVVWAGSLVPPALLDHCRPDAVIHDSASLDLPDIMGIMEEAHRAGRSVVRLHTGDPSLYGAIAEQMDELDRRGVPYRIVPGVSSFSAAAATLETELTAPQVSQTVILTRRAGRTPVPRGEELESLAAHRATLCLFLSVGRMAEVAAELGRHYPPSTPVAVVANASWPEEVVVRGTLESIAARVAREGISKTAMIIVGDVLARGGEPSRLYDPAFAHGYRQGTSAPNNKDTGRTAEEEER